MQILLGANETIVKINSKSISIDYIQHFISTHFLHSRIYKNIVYIPASTQNFYHRTFLLKWLYTLYEKRTKNYLPELKERLVFRQEKAIKIILAQEVIHQLFFTIIDDTNIKIEIKPNNYKIAYFIKTHMRAKMTILKFGLQITITNEEEKNNLKALLYSDNLIDVPHKHIFNKEKFRVFFAPKRTTYNPYLILGVTKNDDVKTIKKRYRHLAKRHHPDMARDRSEEVLQEHTIAFQSLQNAYEAVLEKLD